MESAVDYTYVVATYSDFEIPLNFCTDNFNIFEVSILDLIYTVSWHVKIPPSKI